MSSTIDEYLLTYDYLTEKIGRIDQRIEELASEEEYKENVHKLECFLGIKTQTALSVITETGDFVRFPDADHYAAYLGLVPVLASGGNRQFGSGENSQQKNEFVRGGSPGGVLAAR